MGNILHIACGTREMINFIKVDGGRYDITAEQYFMSDMPVKKSIVSVNDFYIMDFPLEQRDWVKTMLVNPSFFRGDDLPVEQITWYDAIAFCNKKSIEEGLKPCYEIYDGQIQCDFKGNGYRLPTEAEWEYAARGGRYSKNFKYAESDNLDEVAWYAKNSNRMTHPKGQKRENELGLYDMCGNVFEWCWDWYGKYDSTYIDNPTGAAKGKKKVVRGNCWVNGITTSDLERRVAREPQVANHHLGVRLVRTYL